MQCGASCGEIRRPPGEIPAVCNLYTEMAVPFYAKCVGTDVIPEKSSGVYRWIIGTEE